MPFGSATVLLEAMDSGLGIEGIDELEGRTEAREIGCHTDLDELIRPISECTWSVPDSRGTVMLVGDSHAVSLADAVVDLANADGLDAVVRTRSLCPFHSRRIMRTGCAVYQRDTVEEIRDLSPDVLIVANRAPSYVNPTYGQSGAFAIVDSDDEVTTTFEAGLKAWDEGMREVIDDVTPFVGQIVIIETVPEFDTGTASESVSLLTPEGSRQTLTLDEVALRRGPTARLHDEIARQEPGVVVIDPTAVLCTDECGQRLDGRWT